MQGLIPEVKVLQKDGKTFYAYKGKAYPKEFAWFIVVKALQERGEQVFLDYGNGLETEVRWGFDRQNGVAPLEPRKIVLVKVDGEPFDKRTKKLVIDLRRPVDPDPATSISMLELEGF